MDNFNCQTKDYWIRRIAVGAISLTSVLCAGGAIWLGINDKPIPDLLTGLGTGSLGALAGMIMPISDHKQDRQ